MSTGVTSLHLVKGEIRAATHKAVPLPPGLIAEIQRHTGSPWWNGEAYAQSVGYPQQILRMRLDILFALDQLRLANQSLRESGDYENADRIRAAIDRLLVENGDIE